MSLTPPPWEELTTNEPLFKATLVNPPSTNFVLFAPTKQNGLRSTCLGDNSFFSKIGTEDNSSMGCAM